MPTPSRKPRRWRRTSGWTTSDLRPARAGLCRKGAGHGRPALLRRRDAHTRAPTSPSSSCPIRTTRALYAGTAPFLRRTGRLLHLVRHPHGHLPDDARHGHRDVQRGALRGSRPGRGDPRPLRGLGLCRGRARLPDGVRRVRHHRRHGLQDRHRSSPRRCFASW